MLDSALLDLSDILTKEKENKSLLSKRTTWNFPSIILMPKSKKLAICLLEFFFNLALFSHNRYHNSYFQIPHVIDGVQIIDKPKTVTNLSCLE